jgi:predicted Zn finger-like uncharacterized protein
MRIICPNCDAHYEIEASAIPPGGRDVQCSACGHFWFQPSAHPAPAGAFDDLPEDEDAAALDAEDALDPAEAPAAADRPELDPAIRALLREEAERETAARRDEVGAVEAAPADPASAESPVATAEETAQTPDAPEDVPAQEATTGEDAAEADAFDEAEDLHFRAVGPESAEAAGEEHDPVAASEAVVAASPDGAGPADAEGPQDDPERPRETAATATAGDTGAVVPLPVAARSPAPADAGDAYDDASDLSPEAEAALAEEALARRRGFRMGFLGVLLLAFGALWLYVYGSGMPDAGPMLTGYVAVLDGWRVALVARLDAMVEALVQMTVGS